MTIFTTKISLKNDKYYQLTGDTLSLSGTTFIGKAQYIKDASSTYNNRSLIDKGYLDYRFLHLTGSSSTLVSGATNGLTLLNKTVLLGGSLNNNTDIDTNSNTFRLGELSTFGPLLSIDPSNFSLTNFYNGTDSSTIETNNSSLYLTTSQTGKTATYILNQNGLEAANNYFSGNTNNPRWIADKEYIDTHSINGIIFNNGIIKNNNIISLGGSLTGNTHINLNNNSIIFNNGRVISSGNTSQGFDSYNSYKISGVTVFDVNRNNFSNLKIGQNTLKNNTTGCHNIGLGFCFPIAGFSTLGCNTIGCENIAIGYSTLGMNTSGCNNIASGYLTLFNNTTGCNNIANGYSALGNNTIGNNNVSIGYNSGVNNISGSSNIFIGSYAGYYETGNNTLYIDNIDRTSLALGKTNSLLYGIANILPSAQTLTTNSKFTATYGINIPTGNTYTIGNNNIQNHYKHTTITGGVTLTGNEYVIYGNNSALAYTINLPLNPIDETAFKIKDIGGNALVNNITISGNTRNIDGSSTSLINTNYGAVELIFNKTTNKWYTLSSIN